ncbi:hypothetical protein PISL3812_04000 [Talaromyces islandicus]|uniref:SnoaL-like domain-containing protein n=1 Tax=Talaromyces islandicus TaxID=28573 RepID=A0A0U1LU98_TALIS|nr:hypothetical protein PISL3812_04000 [Talaromyces islandicus]
MSTPKHTPRSILNTFYAAEVIYMSAPPEQRDFSGMAAVLFPNIKLVQTPHLPYGGVFTGAAGFQQWAEQMSDLFDVVDVRDPEIFEKEGSNRIVVLSTVHFRVRKTGERMVFPLCQAITVDLEAGQITEMKPFYWDVHTLNKAVGYDP